MSEKFPHTAIRCLTAIALHHGLQVNADQLIEEYALGAKEPKGKLLLGIAKGIGLKAKLKKLSFDELLSQKGVFPLIAQLRDGNSVIIVGTGIDEEIRNDKSLKLLVEPTSARKNFSGKPETSKARKGRVSLINPLVDQAAVVKYGQEEFSLMWNGNVMLLKRQHSILDPNQPFGLRWFIPEILKQRVAFKDIAIAVMALHVLALATPIFFQLVLDKVLSHQSYSTLNVLAIGIVVAVIFETIFSYIRQYLTAAATNKIDMRVTRRAFSKLLSLPIDYFETTTAGSVSRHMQQLATLRNFLTGRLFFTALEATALFVFIPVLFAYSVKLALIVLAFTVVIGIVLLAFLPILRKRLDKLYGIEGKRQAMLVETIRGMRTIKTLALEPAQRRNWDEMSAESITRNFNVRSLMLVSSTLSDLLGKLLPIIIIIVGAYDVFDQTMTVGALIAFQMISGRVSGPLTQMVGLINEYQQVSIASNMLGEIMNRPSERSGAGSLRPKLKGGISLENVVFRYPNSPMTALDGTSFDIPAGAVVGLVGRSGSGKTTITKIIQGLYSVNEGTVRFDGIDSREIDLSHLRREIGIVLQENFLFKGTVRENISITKPDATFDEIVAVAQAAGADEFIERLSMGYDTLLEENASNLSGGQKQRLSIARTLLRNPNILILDEAASALDPESEAIFIRNLSRIAVGRTVLMVSHRLSTLVNADAIMVMQQGRLMDSGRHEELLSRCSTYQHLWNQQTSHL